MNNLNVGQFVINKNLTLLGPGANLLAINAFDPTPTIKEGNGSRVFNIEDADGQEAQVTLTKAIDSFDSSRATTRVTEVQPHAQWFLAMANHRLGHK